MNSSDIKKMMNNPVIDKLAKEACHNPHAMELLENLHLLIESILFFHQRKIENRVQSEIQSLNNTITFLTEIYED